MSITYREVQKQENQLTGTESPEHAGRSKEGGWQSIFRLQDEVTGPATVASWYTLSFRLRIQLQVRYPVCQRLKKVLWCIKAVAACLDSILALGRNVCDSTTGFGWQHDGVVG